MPKKASLAVKKLIESAVANASHNFSLKSDNLFVKEIRVDQGPIMKRSMARARGSSAPIHKHTSHIKVVLAEKDNK
jgi:large subunit ribosomal protein L22